MRAMMVREIKTEAKRSTKGGWERQTKRWNINKKKSEKVERREEHEDMIEQQRMILNSFSDC